MKKKIELEDDFNNEILFLYNDIKSIVEMENKIHYMKKDAINEIKRLVNKNKTEIEKNKLIEIKEMIFGLFDKNPLTKGIKNSLIKIMSKL